MLISAFNETCKKYIESEGWRYHCAFVGEGTILVGDMNSLNMYNYIVSSELVYYEIVISIS